MALNNAPTAQPSNPILKGLQWASFDPVLQNQLAYAAQSDPNLTDVDVNNIILHDPASEAEAQSSPGGFNAGQLAAVMNARGKSFGLSGMRNAAGSAIPSGEAPIS